VQAAEDDVETRQRAYGVWGAGVRQVTDILLRKRLLESYRVQKLDFVSDLALREMVWKG
jgi:hypothetical protein